MKLFTTALGAITLAFGIANAASSSSSRGESSSGPPPEKITSVRPFHSSDLSSRSYTGKHAIVFTDFKLDDLMLIQVLMRPRKYEFLHIVASAVQDPAAAHGHVRDFLARQLLTEQHGNFEPTPYLMYSLATDPLTQDTSRTHESHFLGSKMSHVYDFESDCLKNLPTYSIVDIFHVAPTLAENIVKISTKRDIDIRLYYHLSGYNSNQDAESHDTGKATKKTMDFLQMITKQITSLHPHALIFFTNSLFSFKGSNGSTQPLSAFTGRINEPHLQVAIADPFFRNKLVETERILASERAEAKKAGTSKSIPPLVPLKYAEQPLQKLITIARFMDPPGDALALRLHFADYIDCAVEILSKLGEYPRLVMRLKTAVRDAFENPPSIELSDALQGVVVLDALGMNGRVTGWPSPNMLAEKREIVKVHWYVPQDGLEKGMAMMRVAGPGDEIHGFSIVDQTAEHARELLLRAAPVLSEYKAAGWRT